MSGQIPNTVSMHAMPSSAAEWATALNWYSYTRQKFAGGIGRRCRILSSVTRASFSQPMDIHRSKFDKKLGMFSLKKKIEDSVSRAEILGPTALELEEAKQIKQEELVREYDLWDDLAKSNDILAKLADSANLVAALKDLRFKAEEVKLITELAETDIINFALLKQAYTASVDLSKFLDKYEISKLLKEPYEIEGACVIIEAGPEGIQSEVWAEQLVRMYIKWARKQSFEGRITEKRLLSKRGGIKSVIIEFESKYAYGFFSGERGTHRMITLHHESLSCEVSSAAVDVIPLFLEATPELNIDDKDLVINELSSFKEGQSRIECVIQIQHLPTGLTVESSGERNKFTNEMKALNRLKTKLLVILREQGVSSIREINKEAITNIWHQESRRYVFHPYKHVQDVKTGVQLSDPNSVLNGNLNPFISERLNSRHACDRG